ncbi:MAG: tyrosine-type recombinase/integrase [Acidobacteria bacterium]|nr:tyrosine-type recombinase/integrase [Acidobacteriota bacterium]
MSVFLRRCQRRACEGRKTCKHRHYHYDFWINGTRYRGSIKEARTMDQAEQAEVRIRNEVFEGTYGSSKRVAPLFEEFVNDTYLPWAKTNKRSWKSDELRCKSLVKSFGSKRLDEIAPEMIEAFKTIRRDSIARRGNRLTQASVNRELEVLSKVFNKAIDFERVDRNPCKRVERFTLRKTRGRYFTHAEEARLMNVLTGTLAHIRPVVIVGIGTGLRPPSEIFNLRRSDVDFERNVIRAGTKTNEEREIPIGTAVREVLLDLYNRKTGSEYLFVSYRTGERFKEIKNGFRKALKLAGIKGACLYTMRHTFGTRLGEKGYTSYEIMPLMGHRDIKTSARYVHSTDGRKRAAVESIWETSPHKIPTNGEQPASQAVNG